MFEAIILRVLSKTSLRHSKRTKNVLSMFLTLISLSMCKTFERTKDVFTAFFLSVDTRLFLCIDRPTDKNKNLSM